MKSGDSICYTDIFELAVALTTVGCQLIEGEGNFPYFYHIKGGELRTLWYFKETSEDGVYLTKQLIENYNDPKFFEANPYHPLTIAVHAQRNKATYEHWLAEDTPYVSFNLRDGMMLHTKVGSPDYEEAIKNGLKPL